MTCHKTADLRCDEPHQVDRIPWRWYFLLSPLVWGDNPIFFPIFLKGTVLSLAPYRLSPLVFAPMKRVNWGLAFTFKCSAGLHLFFFRFLFFYFVLCLICLSEVVGLFFLMIKSLTLDVVLLLAWWASIGSTILVPCPSSAVVSINAENDSLVLLVDCAPIPALEVTISNARNDTIVVVRSISLSFFKLVGEANRNMSLQIDNCTIISAQATAVMISGLYTSSQFTFSRSFISSVAAPVVANAIVFSSNISAGSTITLSSVSITSTRLAGLSVVGFFNSSLLISSTIINLEGSVSSDDVAAGISFAVASNIDVFILDSVLSSAGSAQGSVNVLMPIVDRLSLAVIGSTLRANTTRVAAQRASALNIQLGGNSPYDVTSFKMDHIAVSLRNSLFTSSVDGIPVANARGDAVTLSIISKALPTPAINFSFVFHSCVLSLFTGPTLVGPGQLSAIILEIPYLAEVLILFTNTSAAMVTSADKVYLLQIVAASLANSTSDLNNLFLNVTQLPYNKISSEGTASLFSVLNIDRGSPIVISNFSVEIRDCVYLLLSGMMAQTTTSNSAVGILSVATGNFDPAGLTWLALRRVNFTGRVLPRDGASALALATMVNCSFGPVILAPSASSLIQPTPLFFLLLQDCYLVAAITASSGSGGAVSIQSGFCPRTVLIVLSNVTALIDSVSTVTMIAVQYFAIAYATIRVVNCTFRGRSACGSSLGCFAVLFGYPLQVTVNYAVVGVSMTVEHSTLDFFVSSGAAEPVTLATAALVYACGIKFENVLSTFNVTNSVITMGSFLSQSFVFSAVNSPVTGGVHIAVSSSTLDHIDSLAKFSSKLQIRDLHITIIQCHFAQPPAGSIKVALLQFPVDASPGPVTYTLVAASFSTTEAQQVLFGADCSRTGTCAVEIFPCGRLRSTAGGVPLINFVARDDIPYVQILDDATKFGFASYFSFCSFTQNVTLTSGATRTLTLEDGAGAQALVHRSVGDPVPLVTVASLVVGPLCSPVIIAVQKAQMLQAISGCGSIPLTTSLDIGSSPTQLTIGPDAGAYHRGAVMGNTLLLAASCVVAALAAYFVPHEGYSLRNRAALCGLPGQLYIPFSILLLPTMASAITLVANSNSDFDLPLGVVVALFVCVAPSIQISRLVVTKLFAAKPKISPVLAMRGATVPHLLRKLVSDQCEWFDSAAAPRTAAQRKRGPPSFVRCYGALFDIYRSNRHWFVVVDITSALALGLLSANFFGTESSSSKAGCVVIRVLAAVVTLLYSIVLGFAQPYNSHYDMIVAAINASLSTASVIVTLMELAPDAITAAQIWLNVALVVIGVLCRLICDRHVAQWRKLRVLLGLRQPQSIRKEDRAADASDLRMHLRDITQKLVVCQLQARERSGNTIPVHPILSLLVDAACTQILLAREEKE